MNPKYFVFGFMDKELQAIVGLIKLRKGDMTEDNHTKFKKSPFQIEVLKKIYETITFPSSNTKKDLSILLSMPEKSVKVWFQNSRQAFKRSNSDASLTYSETYDLPVAKILEIIRNVRQSMTY
jgi:hypothetical protein